MHILLTGSTGYIGSEVLRQALASTAVTHVTTLTRKPLAMQDAKLTSIVHKDFTQYPDSLISQLRQAHGGVGACIWALGVVTSDTQVGQLVNYDYTLAGAKALRSAFASDTSSSNSKAPFRFVYVSGALVEREQDKSVWFMATARKMRGIVEVDLLGLDQPGAFDVYLARPFGIPRSTQDAGFKDKALVAVATALRLDYIRLNVLGAALLSLGLGGAAQDRLAKHGTVENDELKAIGTDALALLTSSSTTTTTKS